MKKTIKKTIEIYEDDKLIKTKTITTTTNVGNMEYKKRIYEVDGIFFRSLKDLANHFKVGYQSIFKFLKRNYDYENVKSFTYRKKVIYVYETI